MANLKTSEHPSSEVNIERKGIEESLRKSQQLFSTLFSSSPILMAIARVSDNRLISANQSFLAVMGLSLDEIIGRTSEELGLLADPRERAREKERIKKTGSLKGFEMQLRRNGGSFLSVLASSEIVDIDGEKCIFTSAIDITERKRTEEALRISEEKFSKAFKTSPDAIAINRLSDGMYLEINDGFTAITGYAPDDVIGRSSLPEDLGIWVNKEDRDLMVAGLAAHGEVIGLEAPFRLKNGQVRTGSISSRIIEINGEKCILSTTRDISERKHAEQALLSSEAKYRELADTVPVGIFECDLEGKLTFANAILYNWFGYSQDDFKKGMDVIEFVDEKDRDRVRKNLGRLLTSTQLTPNEYTAVRKDGSTFPIMSISTLLRLNGNPTGFRGIHLDLTEKKKLEDVLQNTARLESLGILAGGIAHDFNNLLTGVFGYIDLANLESKDKKVSSYLSNAVGTINRARGLTRQLLTFAKGGAPIKTTGPLFPFVQETAQFALSGAVVSSHFDVPADLWLSEFDRNQIGQVVDNIIINAQQAMPMGGVIEVSAKNVSLGVKEHPTLEKGNYVRIAIKDSGIGIPKDILHRIFDPFFTTKMEGHGLGLATCYSIIKRHGGCIDVESEPGDGSTFHIYLPAVAAGPDLTAGKKAPRIHKRNGVILVMDDEDVVRKTVGAMLNALGFTAVLKKEGKETVEFFQKELEAGHVIDGMFLDLTVPGGMGGKETVLHIRAIDPYVPVFVASGYAEDPVMATPVDYGFTASICKPFTVNELSVTLNKYLKKTIKNVRR